MLRTASIAWDSLTCHCRSEGESKLEFLLELLILAHARQKFCGSELQLQLAVLQVTKTGACARHEDFQDRCAGISGLAWYLEFSEISVCRKASLLEVANFRLGDLALCNLLVADLDCVVAVPLRCLDLSDLVAAVEGYDGATGGQTLGSKDLCHACLGSKQSHACFETAGLDLKAVPTLLLLLRTVSLPCLQKRDRPSTLKAAVCTNRVLWAKPQSTVHTSLHDFEEDTSDLSSSRQSSPTGSFEQLNKSSSRTAKQATSA